MKRGMNSLISKGLSFEQKHVERRKGRLIILIVNITREILKK